MACVIEDETDDRDDKNIRNSSIDKLKHISNLIKPAKKRSSPKEKHVPPPIMTASSSSLSVSASFLRSLTHSRSRLAQQQGLGTLSENGAIEHQYESTFPPLTPRTPHTPCTPRSLWYMGESDDEDIRRPSGLGHRVSISSMPGSPYGGRYPWEVGPELHREPPASEVEEGPPPTEEKGEMKESFRFPNKSVSNVATDSEVVESHVSPSSVRTGGRVRALSSPTLFVSIGTKVKEKLEREMEMEKLMIMGQWSQVHKSNGVADQNQHLAEVRHVEDKASQEEAEVVQVIEELKENENVPQVIPQGAEESEVIEKDVKEDINHAPAQPHLQEPVQPDSPQERERLMSFSLVHMFPEPPSTRPSRPSSDIGHGAITMSSPPLTPPASSPARSQMAKRASSSTVASIMTTASTATMTSLGTNISIINGPFGPPPIAFTPPPTQSPTAVTAQPNGHSHFQPNQHNLYATTTLGTPSTAATTFTFHSFPPSPLAAPIQLPHEVLNLALSYLPNQDIASLARVNKDYAAVVRGLLYSTIDLGSLTDNSDNNGCDPVRVRKLLSLLVKRNDLTALVTKFVCHEWPEWFPLSPYTQHDLETLWNELCEEEDQEVDLENTFLSATLVLALSRMAGLRELVIPSYHSFLFCSVTGTTWCELKSVEFGNVAMEDEEASDMAAWLAGMVGLERLSFPRLAEKANNVSKRSSEIAKHARRGSKSAQRFSAQTHKRCSSCWSPALLNAKTGNGNGTDTGLMLTSPMCFPGCNGGWTGQETQPQEEPGKPDPERVHPLAKFALSRTFLPNLRVLHAPPTISSLLSASPTEGQPRPDGEPVEKPWRPLRDVTINIDMTLYTGLRPTALVQGLHGLKRFGLRFGERVDRRSVEKMLMAVGAALGSGLEELHVEFVDGWAAGADEVRCLKVGDCPRH